MKNADLSGLTDDAMPRRRYEPKEREEETMPAIPPAPPKKPDPAPDLDMHAEINKALYNP